MEGPNPSGICLCGCGQKTSLAARNESRLGHIKGLPVKYIQNHKPFGEKSFNWKGGRVMGRPGSYARVRTGNRYELEHRLLAEKALGKPLPPKAQVHHHTLNQLVVCQDQNYHLLLHRRMRALKSCGQATWNKCYLCKTYDDPRNLKTSREGVSSYHSSCINNHQASKRK